MATVGTALFELVRRLKVCCEAVGVVFDALEAAPVHRLVPSRLESKLCDMFLTKQLKAMQALFVLWSVITSTLGTPILQDWPSEGFPLPEHRFAPPRKQHTLDECMHVGSEEGDYFFKSTGAHGEGAQTTVCGLYLVTEPDMRVEITVRHLEVPCEDGGLVAWVDGWELNGQMFPGVLDHPLGESDRVVEFCGARNNMRTFRSSQNAALLQYRIPTKGKGFGVSVRFIVNHSPCNILVGNTMPSYTLRNHGKRSNCTLSAVYPAAVRVLAMTVGGTHGLDTGSIHKCEKRGMHDYLEVGGTDGLDSSNLQALPTVCGQDSRPGKSGEDSNLNSR